MGASNVSKSNPMKKSIFGISTCASISLILACATPYQRLSLRGGYSDTILAKDVFRVAFRGNAYTSRERAQDLALLRAAELTLEHGFTWFAVIDESDSARIQTYTTQGHATTTAQGTVYNSGSIHLTPYGGTYSGTSHIGLTATTTYTPPETYVFYKPETGLLIKAFATKPDGIFTFDARFLRQSLGQKYHIE